MARGELIGDDVKVTPQQDLIVRLVRVVPDDHWVSFGDLADAMKALGYGCTARNVSNALHSYTDRYRDGSIGEPEWRRINIWGKVRNAEGFVVWAEQGTDRPRGSRIVHDASNPSNVAWLEAGGRVSSTGAAAPSRRWPIGSMARLGRLSVDSSGAPHVHTG